MSIITLPKLQAWLGIGDEMPAIAIEEDYNHIYRDGEISKYKQGWAEGTRTLFGTMHND